MNKEHLFIKIMIATLFNEYYQCLDRLALKYDNRFDISFDKDIEGAKKFGKQNKEVLIIR